MAAEQRKLLPLIKRLYYVKMLPFGGREERVVRPGLPQRVRIDGSPTAAGKTKGLIPQGGIPVYGFQRGVELLEVGEHGSSEGVVRSIGHDLF